MPITIWNRQKQRAEIEKVYGDGFVKALYETKLGLFIENYFLSSARFSKIYGSFQSSVLSKRKIPEFIKNFSIPMEDYENVDYKNFNDFFIRRFKVGKREFIANESVLPAFAEARYSAYASLDDSIQFPVKGSLLNINTLLQSEKTAKHFIGGPAFIARLCPVDYHRFHFPDEGKVISSYSVHGKLHSVNPIALAVNENIFLRNERQVSILETKNFGLLAYIEVGALCVGRIVQSYSSDQSFSRGEEKGYFLFGGSTVILVGEKGKWLPDADLLERTSNKQESLVLLGEGIAKKL